MLFVTLHGCSRWWSAWSATRSPSLWTAKPWTRNPSRAKGPSTRRETLSLDDWTPTPMPRWWWVPNFNHVALSECDSSHRLFFPKPLSPEWIRTKCSSGSYIVTVGQKPPISFFCKWMPYLIKLQCHTKAIKVAELQAQNRARRDALWACTTPTFATFLVCILYVIEHSCTLYSIVYTTAYLLFFDHFCPFMMKNKSTPATVGWKPVESHSLAYKAYQWSIASCKQTGPRV